MGKKATEGRAGARARVPARPRKAATASKAEPARAAKAASTETLLSFADISPNMIFIWTASGVVYANPMCAQVMGYSREELCSPGFDFRRLVAPASLTIVEENLRRHLMGEEVVAYEYQIVTRDGRILDGIHTTKLIDYEGSPAILGIVTDTTERRLAEERLQESERRLRALLDGVAFIAVGLDADGRVTYANPRLLELTGYQGGEIVGQDWFERFAPQWHRAEATEFFRERLLAGGAPAQYESPLLTRTGDERLIAWSSTVLLGEGGGPVGLMSLGEDITERRRAERVLRESEARHRTVLENIDEVVYQVDATPDNPFQANMRFVSGKVGAILGRDPEEFLQDPTLWQSLVHPDDVAAVERQTRLVFTSAQGTTRVYRIHSKSAGAYRWVEDRIVAKVNEKGRSVGFFGVLHDVTERRRAEEEIRRLHRAVEQSPVSVIITDREGRIEYVNACFVQATGYSKEEVLGQNTRLLKSGAQPPEFYKDLWTTIGAGREWQGQFHNRRKDGSDYWSQVVISPVTAEDGEITHFISLGQDITEFRRQETALKQSQAQLIQAQKSEAVGRLAGGIAHDFNNLMNVVGGYAEIVLRRLPPGDPLRGKVDQISQAAARAAGLTRQLLAYSRRQVLQPVIVDLNALLIEHSAMLERLIGEDIELEVRRAPELGRVLADPGQIEQVIMNLAVNARDAMPGGGRLVLSTSNEELLAEDPRRRGLTPPGPYVRMAVADSGCGMSEEIRAHLFEPFFTTKEPGKGTGLGLSTVYGIVRQSGGFIWADSAVGRGTTFEIFLPLVASAPAGEPMVEDSSPVPARGGGRCILLVEDNAPLRALTREILESAGFSIIEAGNGEEATHVARDFVGRIDLLLTDVVLPKLGGRELAIEVMAAHPEAKVLFASGYTADALSVHGVLDAGLAFLPKPSSSDELLSKIAEVLGDVGGPVPQG